VKNCREASVDIFVQTTEEDLCFFKDEYKQKFAQNQIDKLGFRRCIDGDLRVNFCATKNDIPAVVSLFDMEPCKIYYSFHEHKIYFSSWFNSHANIGFSGPTPEGILNNRDERMLKYLMKGFYCCDVGQKMKQQLNLPIN